MYSGDSAPSLSSAAIGSFDQEQFHVDPQPQIPAADYSYDQPPSYTGFGHGQANSNNQFQDGTLNRGLAQTAGFSIGGEAPSQTAFGHGQGDSINHLEDGAHNRGVGQIGGIVGVVEPPSLDAMLRAGVSQPSGDEISDGLPPSLNDVARREASNTGESVTGANQELDSRDYVGISLVGKRFRQLHPTAYYKGED